MRCEANFSETMVTVWRRFCLVPLLFLSVLLFFLFQRSLSETIASFSVLSLYATDLLIIVSCSLLYNLFKAGSLYFGIKISGCSPDYWKTLRLVVQSAFVEVTTFPAKVFGDTYRFFNLPGNRQEKIKALGVFRLTSFVPMLTLWLLVMDSRLIALGMAMLAGIGFVLLKQHFLSNVPFGLLLMAYLGHCLALFTWVVQGYLLLNFVTDQYPNFGAFCTLFILAQTLASVSNIPFGLGVKETVYGLSLSSFLGPEQLLAYLACLRLTGELFSAVMGWFVYLIQYLRQWARSRAGAGGRAASSKINYEFNMLPQKHNSDSASLPARLKKLSNPLKNTTITPITR